MALSEKRFGRGNDWFVIFEDNAYSASTAEVVLTWANFILRYASGRPFLVARMLHTPVNYHHTAAQSAVVLGHTDITSSQHLESIFTGTQIALDTLPGDTFRIIREENLLKVRGTVSGTRKVFVSTAKPKNQFISSNADIAAFLAQSDLNHGSLAARLFFPSVPYALSHASVWNNVSVLPEGHELILNLDTGRSIYKQFWHVPQPELSLDDGAEKFAVALTEAIKIRSIKPQCGADVSGGLDSTPIAYIAANNTRSPLVTFSSGSSDELHDDLSWIDRSFRHFPEVRKIRVTPSEIPSPFEDFSKCPIAWDEPFIGAAQWKRISYTAGLLRSEDVKTHLSGHGGDEVLLSPTSFIHDLIRQKPLLGYRLGRQYKSLYHWERSSLRRLITERISYKSTLIKELRNIKKPSPGVRDAANPWNIQSFRAAPWMSDFAVESASKFCNETIEGIQEPAQSRTQSAGIESILTSGNAARSISTIMGNYGIDFNTPFLDEKVISSALSIRPEDKSNPFVFKPLIKKAMSTLVPHEILSRPTKADGTADVHRGQSVNSEFILDYMETSILGSMGLIEFEKFRYYFSNMSLGQVPPVAFWATLSVENWLRSHN
ncbi:asparagine synthase-related protein [Glutamicibacter sp. NPDC087344]|uniref:asparagine synthase-related protein n=1 Tax=Glutamicibacter sp. NPDC087344 TaxID=3363994 RepID=UPI00382E7FD3